jgi:hypothetical protein
VRVDGVRERRQESDVMNNKTAGLVAALGLLLTACGASSSEPAAGGLGDSIAVHGNWTIDVLNADGSLDRHVEFQNAIGSTGWETLGRFMTGELGIEEWAIGLNGTFCDLPNNYCGLDAEVTYDGTARSVIVTGSLPAPQNGDIDTVRSFSKLCRFDQARDCVPDIGFTVFSSHNVDPPVDVAGGQTVQIEIEFALG